MSNGNSQQELNNIYLIATQFKTLYFMRSKWIFLQ